MAESDLNTRLPTLNEVLSTFIKNGLGMKNTTAPSEQQKTTFELAAIYGKLTSDAVKCMDDELKVDGSPDEDVATRVYQWLTALVDDSDIRECLEHRDTQKNFTEMTAIVAETGTRVTDLLSLLGNRESEKVLFDVGILRYPDMESPFFKLYHIHLFAWRKCTRVLMVQWDNNGIRGEFNCMKFKPRHTVIAGLSQNIIAKAIEDLEVLYS